MGHTSGIQRWFVGSLITAVVLVLACTLVPRPASGQDSDVSSTGSVRDRDVIDYINQMIEEQWEANEIKPSKVASDYEFLRRVYLDLAGRIPSVSEINAFMKLPRDSRRTRIIIHLLKSEDYAKNWANLWTVWLLTRTSPPGVDREAMKLWLQECFSLNMPYDQMVTEILTATGRADENGATNFILSHVGEQVPPAERQERGMFQMVPATSRTTRLFLGIQTQCVQCHDHPFIDSRRQQQYWGLNAFFLQVERQPPVIRQRRRDSQNRYYTLSDNLSANPDGGVYFERRNGLLLRTSMTYLDGTRVPPSEGLNRRKELARLIVNDPHFSKAIVNRLWAHFMGRGFTAVVDDFGEGEDDHNPPSHPELLDRLAKDFVRSGHDLRRLMYWITSSKPYQLTSMANKTNHSQDAEPFFSRMLLKAMTPEQLVDSIFVATNADKTKSSREEQQKMYEEWLRDFTVNFGDDEGNEATFNGTIIQALLLMNGPKLNQAISNRPGSTVHRAMSMRSGQIRYLYLAALCRPPTSAERAAARRVFAYNPSKDRSAPFQDILWALLNSNEFFLNH